MAHADVRDDRHVGSDEVDETLDLADTAHPHLDDQDLRVLICRKYRGGDADLVVLIALRGNGLEALRENRAQEILR